ncbi:MAG TPA: hypothetical protein VEI82_11745 [Myxococcota bacterium]|nr:hypothetical protein [Myxococcota bacterium]
MRPGGAWLALAATLAACTTNVGQFLPDAGQDVLLRENNYKLVKAHAVGQSSGVFLFCLIPLTSPTFSEAKQKLDDSVGEKLEGRAIALTNRSIDRSSTNAVLYSIEKITLTADVIEFESPAPAKAAR